MCEHINPETVTFHVGGNLLYKDECTKCFHTNVGLFLSLGNGQWAQGVFEMLQRRMLRE